MRTHYLAAFLALAFGLPATATDTDAPTSAQLARIAEQIRSGEIDVGNDYSMNVETGRYHIIHADKMLMDCVACHYGNKYRPDYLTMSKHRGFDPEAKGLYVRNSCVGCHQAGGIATRWYNVSTQ